MACAEALFFVSIGSAMFSDPQVPLVHFDVQTLPIPRTHTCRTTCNKQSSACVSESRQLAQRRRPWAFGDRRTLPIAWTHRCLHATKKHWGRACVSECTKLANRRGHGALGGIGKHCRSKTHVPHYIQQHINHMCFGIQTASKSKGTLVHIGGPDALPIIWSTALAAGRHAHTHFAVDSVGRPASAHASPKCILHDLIATDCPKGQPPI